MNGITSSQESMLFDEETFSEIQTDLDTAYSNLLMLEDKDLFEMTLKRGISEEKLGEFLNGRKRIKKEETEQMLISSTEITQQCDDTFAGNLNFQYSFADNGTGQDWAYSQILDKLFIKMEKVLPLRFIWEPPMEGLFLRTAIMFKLEQFRNDPVRRCYNHMADSHSFNQNIDDQKKKHVVHCVNHSASIYIEKNEHLSILTPLRTHEPGSSYMPMCYKFLCKNSCPSGMNRRPTELVFTLENDKGVILGRRKLLIRICSCPKRDKQKEETELLSDNLGNNQVTKRKSTKHPLHSGKKMPSLCDQHVYKVQINIVGKENYLAVLKYAYDIMAGQAVKTGQYELFKPYMDDILHNTP
ncbi:cellular tumor antigen p53 isoform X2 [Odontomachus brunneus]|uniref:cellular tumor antigen p53 isoform X2 n=1 Tax=Odontomachus brunneus TaxID=486640 RepID=UPI0013F1E8B9|nr:cellular tumor antigen p53 isoform X2 [Odontomachus brunneus]